MIELRLGRGVNRVELRCFLELALIESQDLAVEQGHSNRQRLRRVVEKGQNGAGRPLDRSRLFFLRSDAAGRE